jgi:hypothetical protein
MSVGVDAGKEIHWATMVDARSEGLLSRKVDNDEADLVSLIDEVLSYEADASPPSRASRIPNREPSTTARGARARDIIRR